MSLIDYKKCNGFGGDQRSFDVNSIDVKWCKQGLSGQEVSTDFPFDMLMYHIEYRKPIVSGTGQKISGVKEGHVVKIEWT